MTRDADNCSVANHYIAQSQFYVQQAEAMRVLLFKIIRALGLPPDASPTTDDDPLLFGSWRASRVLAVSRAVDVERLREAMVNVMDAQPEPVPLQPVDARAIAREYGALRPSMEPAGPAESFDVEMLAATYESYPWPTLPHGKSRPRDLAEYVVAEYGLVTPARALPTQASDSPEPKETM